MHLFYKTCPLSLARSTSPQVNGALLKLTTPKDIQACCVRGMIYDFHFLITARPSFPCMKRIMLGFVCVTLCNFEWFCESVCVCVSACGCNSKGHDTPNWHWNSFSQGWLIMTSHCFISSVKNTIHRRLGCDNMKKKKKHIALCRLLSILKCSANK